MNLKNCSHFEDRKVFGCSYMACRLNSFTKKENAAVRVNACLDTKVLSFAPPLPPKVVVQIIDQ